jgi:hypothetical protein
MVSQGVLTDFKPGKWVRAEGFYYSRDAPMARKPAARGQEVNQSLTPDSFKS